MGESTKSTKKELFLKAYKNNFGNISEACEAININRGTYYLWIEADKKFSQAVAETESSFIDLAESKLRENVKTGMQKAIEFTLSNRAREKYSNMQTIEHKMPDTVKVVHYAASGPPPEIKERRKDDDTDNNKAKK